MEDTILTSLIVYLRPKTGTYHFKFACDIYDDKFVLTKKRETLFDSNAGMQFTIPFAAIEKIEDTNYLYIKGLQFFINDPEVEYPSSPSKVAGGLVGALITLKRKGLFILYFNKNKEIPIFLDILKKAGVSYEGK